MSNEQAPTVVAENYLTIAPDLTIKVVVLSDGQRVIPEEDMKRACEWLGVDLDGKTPDVIFPEESSMINLTAEVARSDIAKLQEIKSNPLLRISIREEKYLRALEIALPVLAQQERGESEWVELNGKGNHTLQNGRNYEIQTLANDSRFYNASLEQQEMDECGWIEWQAVESNAMPVNEADYVELKWSNGSTSRGRAGNFGWGKSISPGYHSIIAYRVVEQERERGEEE